MSPTDYPNNNQNDDTIRLDLQSITAASEWDKFTLYFLELLDSTHPNGLILFAFLRRLIEQFHLEALCTETDLMTKIYARADLWIHNEGNSMPNPSAWVRRAALTVVQEFSDQQLTPALPSETEIDAILLAALLRTTLDRDLEIVKQAFNELAPEDQNLLNLRLNLPLQPENFNLTVGEVRDQKEQALRRFRDRYYLLRSISNLNS